MSSFSFDGDELKRKMYAAAEKAFRAKVTDSLAGLSGVKVSYTGTFAGGDLKANLSGPEDQVQKAKTRLAAK